MNSRSNILWTWPGIRRDENLDEFTELWAKREFGEKYAKGIAKIISTYTKYNGRRKPELLDANTYSQINYREAGTVVDNFGFMVSKAEGIYNRMPKESRDAFYELVLFPAKACAIVNELYFAAGLNELYAKQGRASTNDMAARVRDIFRQDTILMSYYNHSLAGGKWNHFMDQTHLGYTNWADPSENSLKAVKLIEISIPDTASMGVAIEGSAAAWPGAPGEAILPAFDSFNKQNRYIDIFNKGKKSFKFNASSSAPWILIKDAEGLIEKEKRIWISLDWSKVPMGISTGDIILTGADNEVDVKIHAVNPSEVTPESLEGFIESDGFVSIEAEHYSKNITENPRHWIKIQDYGHTLSAMRATAPAYIKSATPGKDSPCLEYQMYLFKSGTVDVTTINSPTLNFMPDRGLRYAISFDDDPPQIVALVPRNYSAQNGNRDWEKSVADNMRVSRTNHTITKPGYHTLKIWMVDPGVVLQKIIVDAGGLKPSYLGPPESFCGKPVINKEK
jgi:hypothetical protein